MTQRIIFHEYNMGEEMDADLSNTHLLLVEGENYELCRDHVLRFFHKNVLVKYDRVIIVADDSFSAQQDGFTTRLEAGLEQNRKLVQQLLTELQQDGFGDLGRWQQMPQGYLSKTVHEIAHLLDGFFGIDSAFYNLLDDSHWVSTQRQQEIRRCPEHYWLIRADGSSRMPQVDRLPFLRRLGTE